MLECGSARAMNRCNTEGKSKASVIEANCAKRRFVNRVPSEKIASCTSPLYPRHFFFVTFEQVFPTFRLVLLRVAKIYGISRSSQPHLWLRLFILMKQTISRERNVIKAKVLPPIGLNICITRYPHDCTLSCNFRCRRLILRDNYPFALPVPMTCHFFSNHSHVSPIPCKIVFSSNHQLFWLSASSKPISALLSPAGREVLPQ